MAFEVEFTDEFGEWFDALTESEQVAVDVHVRILQAKGPALGRPQVDTLKGSKLANLKELRVQQAGTPLRILFAFDPRRVALLLLGGDKTGDARWYSVNIAKAEAIYAAHLETIRTESPLLQEGS